MRLVLISLFLSLGCATINIDEPGKRVVGLAPAGEVRRILQTQIVGEAGERGDCASQYASDGTLLSSSSDSLSVNCGGGGGQGGVGSFGGVMVTPSSESYGTAAAETEQPRPAPQPAAKKKAQSSEQKKELDESEAILEARRKMAAKEAEAEKQ